jgi:membrane protein
MKYWKKYVRTRIHTIAHAVADAFPVARRFRQSALFVRRVWRRYKRYNGPLLSKGLAFSFVWGTVPLLFLVVVLRSVIITPELRTIISDRLLVFLPEEMRLDILHQIWSLASDGAFPGIVTVLAFLAAAIALFDSLGQALSTMLGSTRGRFHLNKIVSFSLTIGVVFLFYLIAMMAPIFRFINRFLGIHPVVFSVTVRVVSGSVFALFLFGLNRLFAGRKLRFFPSLLTALIAAAAWQGVSIAGSWVFQAVSSRYFVYGAVTWAIIFLLFMRILAEIVVFAGIVTAEFSPSEEAQILALLRHEGPLSSANDNSLI